MFFPNRLDKLPLSKELYTPLQEDELKRATERAELAETKLKSIEDELQGRAVIIKHLWSTCRLRIGFPERVKIEIQLFRE